MIGPPPLAPPTRQLSFGIRRVEVASDKDGGHGCDMPPTWKSTTL